MRLYRPLGDYFDCHFSAGYPPVLRFPRFFRVAAAIFLLCRSSNPSTRHPFSLLFLTIFLRFFRHFPRFLPQFFRRFFRVLCYCSKLFCLSPPQQSGALAQNITASNSGWKPEHQPQSFLDCSPLPNGCTLVELSLVSYHRLI